MSWDDRFLGLAQHVAQWSRDPSTKVGAVIVRPDKTVASIGYNGLPRHVIDDPARLLDRDFRLACTVHAELNAILHASESLRGCSVYVWPFQPCSNCAAAIIQAGIARVVAPATNVDRWRESFERAALMFREAAVAVDLLGPAA